jgi:hypothetical protein
MGAPWQRTHGQIRERWASMASPDQARTGLAHPSGRKPRHQHRHRRLIASFTAGNNPAVRRSRQVVARCRDGLDRQHGQCRGPSPTVMADRSRPANLGGGCAKNGRLSVVASADGILAPATPCPPAAMLAARKSCATGSRAAVPTLVRRQSGPSVPRQAGAARSDRGTR